MNSLISFDLHTHTLYSHGSGSILDNVKAAAAAGLKTVGIADHGPGHISYGIKTDRIPDMRRDIEEAQKLYPGIEILLGVEANLCNPSGKLDVKGENIGLFDYIIAGYHYAGFDEAPVKSCFTAAGGWLWEKGIPVSSKLRNYNTDIAVKALYENDIKIITHPGDKSPVDLKELAKACEQRGTLMEINDHHKCLTEEGISIAAQYGVSFVLSSDAHRPGNVGMVQGAYQRALNAGLDISRIVNFRRE